MKRVLVMPLIFIIVLVSSAYITMAQQEMLVEISISKNDIIKEKVQLDFVANYTYDTFSFTTINQPLSVIYDNDYSIKTEDGYYLIEFKKNIINGKNSINFTLLYSNIIERVGKQRIFRTSFHPSSRADITISLNLPVHFALSEKEPSAIPKPDSIASDGQRINLVWEFSKADYADISIFYKSGTNYSFIVVISVLSLVIISFIFFFFYKKKIRKHIDEMLSSEEQKVIWQIRNNLSKQKEIAQKLEFSKSKMSKIARRLEEKGLIERKPYFKTNILKLKNKI